MPSDLPAQSPSEQASVVAESDVSNAPSTKPRGWRRAVRWVRNFVAGLVGFFVVLTIASLIFNAFTTPPETVRPPQGQDVKLSTGRMHFQRWGTPSSEPALVLVHGFAEHSSAWNLVGPALAQGREVFAIDLPGAGYSQYTGQYSLTDQSDAVADFIAAQHLAKPIVVGHSLGAAVVGALALHHPQSVGGIIFADGDALPFAGASGRNGFASVITRTPYFTSLYRIATRWTWLDTKIFKSACGNHCAAATPGFIDAWMAPMRQGAAENAMKTTAQAPMLSLTPGQIQQISVPRAIVWGAEDTRSGGSLAQTRVNLHHPGEVIIPNAGHLSMVAQPTAFADAVSKLADAMRA